VDFVLKQINIEKVLLIIFAVFLCALYIGITKKIILKRLDKKTVRNIAHSLLFSLCAIGVFTVENYKVLIVFSLGLIIFNILGVELHWYETVMIGNRYRDYGMVGSAIGIALLVLCFHQYNKIIILALCIVGFADPMASFVGRKTGKHKVKVFKGEKSIEGTIAFFLTTLIICSLYMSSNDIVSTIQMIKVIGFSVAVSILELITPSFLDNIVIQFVSGIILYYIFIV
jgi:phytol kinase